MADNVAIFHAETVKQFCQGDMGITMARVVLMNYVYHTTGITALEFMTAEITNIPNFEKHITIACNFFNSI